MPSQIPHRGVREAGCEWLHIDYESHLDAFYLAACGSRSTDARILTDDLTKDAGFRKTIGMRNRPGGPQRRGRRPDIMHVCPNSSS